MTRKRKYADTDDSCQEAVQEHKLRLADERAYTPGSSEDCTHGMLAVMATADWSWKQHLQCGDVLYLSDDELRDRIAKARGKRG